MPKQKILVVRRRCKSCAGSSPAASANAFTLRLPAMAMRLWPLLQKNGPTLSFSISACRAGMGFVVLDRLRHPGELGWRACDRAERS